MSIRGSLFFLSASCILWSGCLVGPDYRRPETPVTDNFRAGPETPPPESIADLPWWDIYRDPNLQFLIRTALMNNYDLGVAIARVEQARAFTDQTRSQFFPQLGYQGAINAGKNEFLGSPNPRNGDSETSALADLNAFWEIDLWGRIRRLNEAARAAYLATEEARRGVILTLVSDVAQAYFELLELDLQLEIARRTTDSFRQSLELFSGRLKEGVASTLETSRTRAALANAAASIPVLERATP